MGWEGNLQVDLYEMEKGEIVLRLLAIVIHDTRAETETDSPTRPFPHIWDMSGPG
jgi:hypothetical protein